MKGKKIYVDMDWVIAKLTPKMLLYYNTIFNDSLTIEDITEWDLRKVVKKEAQDYILNIFKLPGFYRDFEVVEGSQEVLKILSNMGYDIYIITDPFSVFSLEDKWNWLQEHFPFIPSTNYIFTGDKSIAGDGVLIDDAIHHLESFRGDKILFDAPYNRHRDDFVRVYNWLDILELFKE